jgi:hypothetical protein
VIIGFIGRSSTPDEIFWDGDVATAIDSLPPPRERKPTPVRQPAVPPVGASVDAIRDSRNTGEHRVREQATDESRSPQEVQAARRKRRRRGNRGNRPPGSTPPGPRLPDTPSGSAE